MKKSDIAMVILIASVGVLIAYAVATNITFLKLPDDGAKVKTIRAISSDITDPSEDVFNVDAINPTVEVIVGRNAG